MASPSGSLPPRRLHNLPTAAIISRTSESTACFDAPIVQKWDSMKEQRILATLLLSGALFLTGCRPITAPTPATFQVTFAIANGATGFAATIYAQEVERGDTVTALYAAHSAPITMTVRAPGVYVLYARLVEAPDDYHFGASTCPSGETNCDKRILSAFDVTPGGVYTATITDRSPDLPMRDRPVAVPWRRQP